MGTSASDLREALANDVKVTRHELKVFLSDGRTIAAPLTWYPRLLHGSPQERAKWRLIGSGAGIHWETLDEDISVEGLLAGLPSGESQESLNRWLDARAKHIEKRSRRRG